jgi:hypothetical protein
MKKIAADKNYRELKYTNKLEKFAQAAISVSGEAPSKIAGDAVKPLMLTLLRPLKQQNNKQIYLIQMNLNLGVNKKDNKYDAKESTASLAIVYADTPHAKSEDLSALSGSDAAKEASREAMLKLIDVFNKDPVGKMPDPKQDPTEVPIRFVPRPREAYEWVKKDILKV